LQDCQVHGAASAAELFVVEGDSAAFAVASQRDPRLQAVLAMQGKPLNAVRASAKKVWANPLFCALTEALGTGWGGSFDPEALRYGRVILLTDPDADGIHCGALLLMFVHRWLPQLIELGRLAIVRAPMGEIRRSDGGQPEYVYTDAHFQATCAELRRQDPTSFRALRYRGLANIEPAVLETLCINPITRHLRTLTSSDAATAMEVFSSVRGVPSQRPLL
jgi:DNA gyrase subunit B/topoisomerase-4 subunit B